MGDGRAPRQLTTLSLVPLACHLGRQSSAPDELCDVRSSCGSSPARPQRRRRTPRIWRSTSAAALRRADFADHTAGKAIPK